MQQWLHFPQFLIDRPLRSGNMVQDYRIVKMLGIGSYGYTYLVAADHTSKMKVLKQLRKRKLRMNGHGLFQREKKILKRLHHSSIPRLYDEFEWQGRPFFVMEQMPGKTFEDLIFGYHQVFTEREAFQITRNILDIVAYFHRKEIVHRDLRIPNILYSEKENKISIIDFGLACHVGDADEANPEPPPMREPYFRSDFYALGHFMLFLLYSGYRTAEKKERPWYEELPLSEEGCLILKRMLQIEQAYETVDELIADMEAWLQAADAEEMVFKKTGNSRF